MIRNTNFRFRDLPLDDEILELEPEVKMWRAVIDQAIEDAVEAHYRIEQLSQMSNNISKKRQVEQHSSVLREACSWLRGRPSTSEEYAGALSGFEEVCALAWLNPEEVKQKAADLLDEEGIPQPYRNCD